VLAPNQEKSAVLGDGAAQRASLDVALRPR
jgi:hypothetical protein